MSQPIHILVVVVVLVSLVTPAGAGTAGASDGRLWPIAIDINLASSFGEYRSGHLHAGIDIKTYGQEGVPCRAVDDGYISRMRASPNGYGKAVYIKLDGGQTAVYAHLAEFSPALEAALFEGQVEADRYTVDLYFERGRFPVSRGEVIGYTGRTGTSAPHLHFEIRDENENPLNPLSQGWLLDDASAPRIKNAMFIPLSKETTIDGWCRAATVRLQDAGGGRYVALDTLRIDGQAGIAAQIVDRLNATSGRLAPYRVELTVDGVLLTSISFDSFTYRHTGEVELAYEIGSVRTRHQNYLMLFRRRGETLWNRSFVNNGVIDTALLAQMVGERKDVYTIVVRTVDRGGNVAAALIPFRVGTTESPPAPVAGDDIGGCYFFEDLMSIRGETSSLPPFDGGDTGSLNGEERVVTAADVVAAGPERVFDAAIAGRQAYVVLAQAGEKTVERLPRLDLDVVVDAQSLYADAFLYFAEWDGGNGSSQAGLLSARAPIEIGPASLAVKRPIEIRLTGIDDMDDRSAFYQLDLQKNEWSYSSSVVIGDTLVTALRGPGIYAVLVDRVAPRVAPALVKNRTSYATGASYRELVIPIEDQESGVDDERTTVFVNGSQCIARWDGFTDRMSVRLRDDVGESFEVSVTAVDHVGNRVEFADRITLSQASEDD